MALVLTVVSVGGFKLFTYERMFMESDIVMGSGGVYATSVYTGIVTVR